jgi:hypothetical protein
MSQLWRFRNSFVFKNRALGLQQDGTVSLSPGADPTKHDFSNFTQICKIFLQVCVKFLTY